MSKGSCELCGTRFDNVFEAVDHARKSGREGDFNPKFILGATAKLNLGLFFKQIYVTSHEEFIKEKVAQAYALLYIAEMRPTVFPIIYKVFTDFISVEKSEMDLSPLVYKIVSQEAYKEVGLR